jgi:hypothetical protein
MFVNHAVKESCHLMETAHLAALQVCVHRCGEEYVHVHAHASNSHTSVRTPVAACVVLTGLQLEIYVKDNRKQIIMKHVATC